MNHRTPHKGYQYDNDHRNLHEQDNTFRRRYANSNQRGRGGWQSYRNVHNPAVPSFHDLDRAPQGHHQHAQLNYDDEHDSLIDNRSRRDSRRLSIVSQPDPQRIGSKRGSDALSPPSSPLPQTTKKQKRLLAGSVSNESEPGENDARPTQREDDDTYPVLDLATPGRAAATAPVTASDTSANADEPAGKPDNVQHAGRDSTGSVQPDNDSSKDHGNDKTSKDDQTTEYDDTTSAHEGTTADRHGGSPRSYAGEDSATSHDQASDHVSPSDPTTENVRASGHDETTAIEEETTAPAEGQSTSSEGDIGEDSTASDDQASEHVSPSESTTEDDQASEYNEITGAEQNTTAEKQPGASEGATCDEPTASADNYDDCDDDEELPAGTITPSVPNSIKEEPDQEKSFEKGLSKEELIGGKSIKKEEAKKDEGDEQEHQSDTGPRLTIDLDVWNEYMVKNKAPKFVHVGAVEGETLRRRLGHIKEIVDFIGSQDVLATIPDGKTHDKLSGHASRNWSTPFLKVILILLKETKEKREREANSRKTRDAEERAAKMPREGASDGERIGWLMGEVARLTKKVDKLEEKLEK